MTSPNYPHVIEINNLLKVYDKVPAVNNLSLRINKGEIFGFLGPNGAGKTTTIKMMLGLVYPQSGNVKINGYDVNNYGKSLKKFIGYMPEQVAFYNNLTAKQNLEFYAELKNVPKQECVHLINEFGLADSMNKKVGKFSKGMKQRLGMARAILGNPNIIILDEPSSGLDPRGVKLIRDKIKQLGEQGATLFISSHILSEIQAVCTQVGIVDKGRLVAQNDVGSLSKFSMVKAKIFFEVSNMSDKIKQAVEKLQGVERFEIRGKIIEILCDPENRSDVVVKIHKAGAKITNLWTMEPSLEDVFMKYTEG